MFSLVTTITFLLTLSPNITPTSAAHAGFHVQFPWTSRGPNPKTRPGLDEFNPFCSTFSPPLYSCQAAAQPDTDKGPSYTTRNATPASHAPFYPSPVTQATL